MLGVVYPLGWPPFCEVMAVNKILLVMYRRLMRDAMSFALARNPDFDLFWEQDYHNAVCAARTYRPHIVVLEIPEGDSESPADYLEICANIKAALPCCRLMLMCPENSVACRQAAVAAMQSGAIADFIYYDVSMDYLLSKLEVLSAEASAPDL